MEHRVVRFLLRLLLAVVIAAAATWGVSAFWFAIGGGPLSIHGWIAMILGVLGSVGLSWLLMSLAFRSDREGWDDEANTAGDPEKDVRRD